MQRKLIGALLSAAFLFGGLASSGFAAEPIHDAGWKVRGESLTGHDLPHPRTIHHRGHWFPHAGIGHRAVR